MKLASGSWPAQWLGIFWVVVIAPVLAADGVDNRASTGSGVLEHHGSAQRTGMFVVPSLTFERAAHVRRDPAFNAAISGAVYAQPLYWHAPGNDKALLIIATEQNDVYALDALSGAVVWKTSLGPPVPRAALPCGNIDPLGITGTPVIDERSRALYVAALIKAQDGPKHEIFALSLGNGAILSGWPIDVEAKLKESGRDFRSEVQNQRGALTILQDTLYVPYGGHFGDCGDYRGRVVGVSLQQRHVVHS